MSQLAVWAHFSQDSVWELCQYVYHASEYPGIVTQFWMFESEAGLKSYKNHLNSFLSISTHRENRKWEESWKGRAQLTFFSPSRINSSSRCISALICFFVFFLGDSIPFCGACSALDISIFGFWAHSVSSGEQEFLRRERNRALFWTIVYSLISSGIFWSRFELLFLRRSRRCRRPLPIKGLWFIWSLIGSPCGVLFVTKLVWIGFHHSFRSSNSQIDWIRHVNWRIQRWFARTDWSPKYERREYEFCGENKNPDSRDFSVEIGGLPCAVTAKTADSFTCTIFFGIDFWCRQIKLSFVGQAFTVRQSGFQVEWIWWFLEKCLVNPSIFSLEEFE